MLVWKQERKGLYTAGEDVIVERSIGGWGQRFNAYCKRPWAAKVDGSYLTTAKGDVRTFGSSDTAKQAAEDAVFSTLTKKEGEQK